MDAVEHVTQAPAPKRKRKLAKKKVASKAVAVKQPTANAVTVSDISSVTAMIMRAASDPAIDVNKFERLMAMHKDMAAADAQRAYDENLAAMQSQLPVITRRGKIEIRKKDAQGNRTGDVEQSTGYARWEDINEAIKPVLKKFGFSLSFRVGTATDGKLTVTGILARAGHREETMITLMHDSTGSKNSVQAVGSSTSYGKRYTASALLNLTSRGEDDDGKAGGAPIPISAEQLKALIKLADEAGADKAKFCNVMKVDAMADIPASRFEEAVGQLQRKLKAKALADAKKREKESDFPGDRK